MDSASFFILFLCVFLFMGMAVLCSYLWFVSQHYMGKSATQQQKYWSLWGNYPQQAVWFISAFCATIGFLCFSAWVLNQASYVTDMGGQWVVIPYATFLIFSTAYTPLMISSWGNAALIADLILVAASAVTMLVWCVLFMQWNQPFQGFIMVFMLVLAIHCTFFDCIIWGYGWCSGKYYAIENSSGRPELVTATLSKFKPKYDAWPTISSYDLSVGYSSSSSSSSAGMNLRF
jgi:hypothetical protein